MHEKCSEYGFLSIVMERGCTASCIGLSHANVSIAPSAHSERATQSI